MNDLAISIAVILSFLQSSLSFTVHSLLRPHLNLLFHSYQIQFQTFLCRTLLFNNFSLYLARTTTLFFSLSPLPTLSLCLSSSLCSPLFLAVLWLRWLCAAISFHCFINLCGARYLFLFMLPLCSQFQFQFHFQSPCKFLHNPRAKFLTEINSFLSHFLFCFFLVLHFYFAFDKLGPDYDVFPQTNSARLPFPFPFVPLQPCLSGIAHAFWGCCHTSHRISIAGRVSVSVCVCECALSVMLSRYLWLYTCKCQRATSARA